MTERTANTDAAEAHVQKGAKIAICAAEGLIRRQLKSSPQTVCMKR